jgi:O-antigen/teichoic acid export membrane protein
MRSVRGGARAARAEHGIDHGIWTPFRSLLLAQVLAAILGLVFWVMTARLVDASQIGIAAVAISAQTLLALLTVLGFGTMVVSELPAHGPARQRTIALRSLLVVSVSSGVAGAVVVALQPLLPPNLHDALANPVGATTFVVGTAAACWALVIDDVCLGLKRSGIQVARNLVASSLRFPVTAVLLFLGFTDAHVIQLCWVLPVVISVPFAWWRLRLPRGDRTSPPLLSDVRGMSGLALKNHLLSLSLASASQMVPVVAGLTLVSVDNAEFTIAWLMASFVFLPPYLLSTALFAHGANVSAEEFRSSMQRTIPAALLLSGVLCVGAWVLGEPVLLIFGGDYSRHSWEILALLAPAGLWMVFKDHLVALWRTERRFSLATRLATAALAIEVTGTVTGGIIGGARGLCVGWLVAMGVEMGLSIPWLRQAFGGLRWQWPLPARRRSEAGRVAPHVLGALALVLAMAGVGVWTATRGDEGAEDVTSDENGLPPIGAVVDTCAPTADRLGPKIDLNVQSATGDPADPLRGYDAVRQLVKQAQQAGAEVISTTVSFRTMQPEAGGPINFEALDRTVGAARSAGLEVKVQLVGMPDWAMDDPEFEGQAPRTEAELQRWTAFVDEFMRHVKGKVSYLEVWNEPNDPKWWPTGPDPEEFTRLLAATYSVVHTVSPKTLVISGGLNGNDIGFLKHMYAARKSLHLKASPFDMVGTHPFSGAAAPDVVDPDKRYERDPYGLIDENFTGFSGLHHVMVEAGDDLPVYITQFGYSVRAAKGREAVPDDVRATYLTQAFEEATCATYVPVFSWYAMHPTPWDPQEFSLVDRQGRPNRTYFALQDWSRRVADVRP